MAYSGNIYWLGEDGDYNFIIDPEQPPLKVPLVPDLKKIDPSILEKIIRQEQEKERRPTLPIEEFPTTPRETPKKPTDGSITFEI